MLDCFSQFYIYSLLSTVNPFYRRWVLPTQWWWQWETHQLRIWWCCALYVWSCHWSLQCSLWVYTIDISMSMIRTQLCVFILNLLSRSGSQLVFLLLAWTELFESFALASTPAIISSAPNCHLTEWFLLWFWAHLNLCWFIRLDTPE